MDVIDLKKYLDVYGGVLYFVVFMSADLKIKNIYFIQLLPYDLQEILTKKVNDNQKTIRLPLKELPNDTVLLQKLCDEFISNQTKQKSAKYIGFGNLDEIRRNGIEFQEIQFGTVVADTPYVSSRRTWCNGTYQYGITAEGQCFVFGKMDAPVDISAGIKRDLVSGESHMKTTVFVGEDLVSEYIQFGSFKARFGQKNTLTFTPTGTFREQLRDTEFLLSILENGSFGIDGIEHVSFIDESNFDKQELILRIDKLKTIVEVLNVLKIKHDFVPQLLTDYEIYQLEKLGANFVRNEHVPLCGIDGDVVNLNIDIQNERIKIIAKKQEDGLYVLHNPLAANHMYAIGIDDPNTADSEDLLSAFFFLNEEDLRLAANIDVDDFRDSVNNLPFNAATVDFGTEKLLQMLQAFDSEAVCKNELLDCAEILADELLRVEPNSEAALINKAQIERRKGSLSADRKKELMTLVKDTDSEETTFCVYLLLGHNDLAASALENMDKDRAEIVKQWPIMIFLKNIPYL